MQQGRFAGARLAHQRHEFAAADFEVEVRKHDDLFFAGTEDFRQLLGAQN
jgi:hypothetical protein